MMLALRLPMVPALISDIIIDTDSESEDEVLPKTPPTPTAPLQTFIPQSRKSPPILAPNQRYIAGSKRVHRFRETQGICVAQKGREILQSITAVPALGHQSFEELRMECYMQCQLATGSSPRAVDPVKSPWEVIPPAFNAFSVVSQMPNSCEGESVEVEMQECPQ